MATVKEVVDKNLKCGDLPTTRGKGCGANNFQSYRTPAMLKTEAEVDFVAKCMACGAETAITMKSGIIKPSEFRS